MTGNVSELFTDTSGKFLTEHQQKQIAGEGTR
jgi:hypothetical protein